jgi:hypothetical protein
VRIGWQPAGIDIGVRCVAEDSGCTTVRDAFHYSCDVQIFSESCFQPELYVQHFDELVVR